MMPMPAVASDTARRLWASAAGDGRAPEEVAAAVEAMCTQLRVGLGRWIGAEGYRALLERALEQARVEHPALGGLSCLGGDGLLTTAAVRAHGAGEVAAGFVALVAALIELLGRIIGDEMALRLVAQTGIPTPRRVVSTDREGEPDGRDG
jgi:hypothetical protein